MGFRSPITWLTDAALDLDPHDPLGQGATDAQITAGVQVVPGHESSDRGHLTLTAPIIGDGFAAASLRLAGQSRDGLDDTQAVITAANTVVTGALHVPQLRFGGARAGRWAAGPKTNSRGVEQGPGAWSLTHDAGPPATAAGETLVIAATGWHTLVFRPTLNPRPTGVRTYLGMRIGSAAFARQPIGEEEIAALSWSGLLTGGSAIAFPTFVAGAGTYTAESTCTIIRHE